MAKRISLSFLTTSAVVLLLTASVQSAPTATPPPGSRQEWTFEQMLSLTTRVYSLITKLQQANDLMKQNSFGEFIDTFKEVNKEMVSLYEQFMGANGTYLSAVKQTNEMVDQILDTGKKVLMRDDVTSYQLKDWWWLLVKINKEVFEKAIRSFNLRIFGVADRRRTDNESSTPATVSYATTTTTTTKRPTTQESDSLWNLFGTD